MDIVRIGLGSSPGWINDAGDWMAGRFFARGTLFEGAEALEYLRKGLAAGFEGALREANGSFAAVIAAANRFYLITDKLRSIPLFYLRRPDGWLISDRLSFEDGAGIDELGVAEVRLCGYTMGSRTMVDGARQVDAGQYVAIDRTGSKAAVERVDYYRHAHRYDRAITMGEGMDEADRITCSFTDRLIRSVKDRRIVLPLSGGYDSRYIAAALHRAGFENMIAYTYGRPSSHEVRASRAVADRLGIPWHFVEYDEGKMSDLIEDKAFFDFCSNAAALPHVQEYIAVKELKKLGILADGDIVVPGFCGDLLGGSYYPEVSLAHPRRKISPLGLPFYIFMNHLYIPSQAVSLRSRAAIYFDIRRHVAEKGYEWATTDEFIGSNEEFFTQHKVAKYVVNSLRVYEYFSLDWRMPLWDDELIDFWYSVPNSMRRPGCHLYSKYLFERLFLPAGVAFEKPREEASRINRLLLRYLPNDIYYFLRHLSIQYRSRMEDGESDFDGFNLLADRMRAQMERRGVSVKLQYILQVVADWYLESRLSPASDR